MISKHIFIFFIFIFFSKELFFFDEELLVVFSFFIIFITLFYLLKSLISSELETRSNLIYVQFLEYLKAKKDLLNLMLFFYNQRTSSLILKLIETFEDFSLIIQNNFKVYLNSLIFWSHRSIVSQLMTTLTFENLYLKKEILSVVLLANLESRVNFFGNQITIIK